MKLSRLLTAEMKFRPLTTLVACAAVWIAAACVSAAVAALVHFDRQTNAEILALQQRAQERMSALENEARVFAKSLGFNIFVYNSRQDLGRFYTTDTSDHFLTMQQAADLAESDFEYLNHLLPILRERYHWEAYSKSVIIGGIQGEIYVKQDWQEPMEVELVPGEVHLGHDLAAEFGIRKGDTVAIGKRHYRVADVRQGLGTKDDITIFMNLRDAQELLDRPGLISGILALSCNCAAGEIEPIRDGVRKIIGGSDVVEFTTRAQARARARKAVAETAAQEIGDIQSSRAEIRRTLSAMSLSMSAIITLVSTVLLVFLYGNNVRERRSEVAVLRALGVSVGSIHSLFMAKALMLAVAGSIAGVATGLSVSLVVAADTRLIPLSSLLTLTTGIVLVASMLSLLACWWPTRYAARRDPGMVLNEN